MKKVVEFLIPIGEGAVDVLPIVYVLLCFVLGIGCGWMLRGTRLVK